MRLLLGMLSDTRRRGKRVLRAAVPRTRCAARSFRCGRWLREFGLIAHTGDAIFAEWTKFFRQS